MFADIPRHPSLSSGAIPVDLLARIVRASVELVLIDGASYQFDFSFYFKRIGLRQPLWACLRPGSLVCRRGHPVLRLYLDFPGASLVMCFRWWGGSVDTSPLRVGRPNCIERSPMIDDGHRSPLAHPHLFVINIFSHSHVFKKHWKEARQRAREKKIEKRKGFFYRQKNES